MSLGARVNNGACLNCLGSVPCASLFAWILMTVGLAGSGAGLVIGVHKTRALLSLPQLLGPVEEIAIAVCVSMFCFSCLLLLVASLSTGYTSRNVFNTSTRNLCARIINISLIGVTYLVSIAWLLVCCVLTVPLLYILLLHVLHNGYHLPCINLKHYAITDVDQEYCGAALTRLWDQCLDASVCYIVAYVSAILVKASLIHFCTNAGANYVHLKETRYVYYNDYKDESKEDLSKVMNNHDQQEPVETGM